MVHAYRLVYPPTPSAPDPLWEWQQPWIAHLLWHGRTFSRQVELWWFPSGDALDRTNTQKVLGVGFDRNVIGNTWWAFNAPDLSTDQRKALLLWINSTLSLLFYYGRRAITEGAWMQMKKPAWFSMSVLDVRTLDAEQLRHLSAAYDTLAQETLAPLAQLDHDATRHKIDDALSQVLGLPSLASIRELLAREPGLTAKEINPRLIQGALDLADEDEDAVQTQLL